MNSVSPAVREMTVNDLNELIAKHEDVLIIDVREREQYAQGHIPHALIVPAGSLGYAADPTSVAANDRLIGARSLTVVVYCDDGRRSRVATAHLGRLGFTAVYWLAGGLKQWQNQGFPVVR